MIQQRVNQEHRTARRRHWLELEELCVLFERTWQPQPPSLSPACQPPLSEIADYLAQAPKCHRAELLEELIAIECELLTAADQRPAREDYHRQFPDWPDAVDNAFDSWQATQQSPDRQMPDQLGNFRIVREIGRGGMGVVYEAVQETVERRVAVKAISISPARQSENVKRFEREIRAVGALHHANIVKIHSTGEQDGLLYYAMQLVDGKNLSRIVKELRRAECSAENGSAEAQPRANGLAFMGIARWATMAEIGLQVARALSYAHGRGVLHRDIKPANLLLDGGTVVVTDFGLAKMVQAEGAVSLTLDVVGTLRYLPPEALDGHWDERGDVYGLGATLYELLTLRPAFDERRRTVLLEQIRCGKQPLSPRKLDPSIPRVLEAIVLRAIAHEPRDRYQSAGDFAGDLTRFLAGEPVDVQRPGLFKRVGRVLWKSPVCSALAAAIIVLTLVGGSVIASLRHQVEELNARIARPLPGSGSTKLESSVTSDFSIRTTNRSVPSTRRRKTAAHDF